CIIRIYLVELCCKNFFLRFGYMYDKLFSIVCTVFLCFIHSSFSASPHFVHDSVRERFNSPSLTGIHEFTIVEKNNKKGLFDENGKVILPIEFDDLGWSKGMPEVLDKVIGYREGNLWGLISLKNKKITPPLYASLEPLSEEFIIASKRTMTTNGRLYGIVDTKGREIMDFRYYSLQHNGDQLISC